MFRNAVAFVLLFAIANAGYLESPLAYHAPIVAAPIAIKAALPVATSYQNTVHISSAAVPVVVKAAPIYAAPAVHYAHAPAIIKSPLLAAPLAYNHYH